MKNQKPFKLWRMRASHMTKTRKVVELEWEVLARCESSAVRALNQHTEETLIGRPEVIHVIELDKTKVLYSRRPKDRKKK